MMFLTIALFASASLVRHDDTSDDQWCCCDPKKVRADEEMICLTDEGYKTLLEVEDPKADAATDGFSVLVEDTIVRSCVDETPQRCAGECLTKSYVTFAQRERTVEFDREYTLPVEKWAAAKYKTKYYSAEAQGRKHVLETESGNVYAKVGDASKHGLAKKESKFCTRYETYAYWKFSESDGGDKLIEKAAAGFTAVKNMMDAWSCVEKKKCVQYVMVADACGAKNVVRGDGEEKDLEDLTGLGGELYELVGRKGQCEDPEVKDTKMAGISKWMKDFTGTAGAGSQCPSGMFHSSKGRQNSPDIPYRFCDCNGECK